VCQVGRCCKISCPSNQHRDFGPRMWYLCRKVDPNLTVCSKWVYHSPSRLPAATGKAIANLADGLSLMMLYSSRS
jgi:hypothetical protein